MSIASELSALNGYILGAYDEINDKGGTVPTNKNMANLASAIASISGGGGGGVAGLYAGVVSTDSDTGASIAIEDAFPAKQGCPRAVFLYEMNKKFNDGDMATDGTRYPKLFASIRKSASSTGSGNQYADSYYSFIAYTTRSSSSYSDSSNSASVSKQFYDKTSAGTNGYDLCTGYTTYGRLYVRSGLSYGIRPNRQYRWIVIMDEFDS